MFDIITISITNINLKCTKVFPLLIIYHNKFLSYFNKITLISYAFVYMKDQTLLSHFSFIVACKYVKTFDSFINTNKINLDSFCGVSRKQLKFGGGGLSPLFLNIGGALSPALAPPAPRPFSLLWI